ncbi:MAG TPA: hypothetical protein VJJ79_02050 [Candidatus Nanoarchaeia archaeon]|nr:hypothetical protein [Candidatus Nanoarchaeia archaeon]
MSIAVIKQQAQAIIDISYKENDKDTILHLAKTIKDKVLEERKKYV